MESLNSVGHAVSNDKSNLDAGCKALLGCNAIAAFVVKNCIAEFEGMSVDEIANRIVGTPEIGLHNVDDLPERIDEKNVESKSVNEGTLYYDVLFDIRLPDTIRQKSSSTLKPRTITTPATPYLLALYSIVAGFSLLRKRPSSTTRNTERFAKCTASGCASLRTRRQVE